MTRTILLRCLAAAMMVLPLVVVLLGLAGG